MSVTDTNLQRRQMHSSSVVSLTHYFTERYSWPGRRTTTPHQPCTNRSRSLDSQCTHQTGKSSYRGSARRDYPWEMGQACLTGL